MLASLSLLAVLAVNRSDESPNENFRAVEYDIDSLRIQITNSYGEQPRALTSGMYPWSTSIVEPYRNTTFTLVGGNQVQSWNWEIIDLQTGQKVAVDTARISYNKVEFTVEKEGGLLFEVVAMSDNTGNHKTIVKEPFVTKWVRRELRKLNAKDQQEYLDALVVIYTTRTREGRVLYGNNFISATWLIRWHLGAKGYNSPYHGAPSFFTAHTYFASKFEMSMQSINPSLAMHYWDFTIDAEEFAPPKSWDQSFFFSEDWFGPETNTSDTEKRVPGRFHDVKLLRNATKGGDSKKNSYGLMTEMFNNNPSEYLTRTFSICGLRTTRSQFSDCTVLKGTFTEFQSMTDFHTYTEFNLHIRFHALLGGMWDCALDLDREIKQHGDRYLVAFTAAAFDLSYLYLDGWNDGYYSCPGSCPLSVPFEDCLCVDKSLSAALERNDTNELVDFFFTRVIEQLSRNTPNLKELLHWDFASKTVTIGGYSETEVEYIMKSILVLVSTIPKISQFASPLGSGNDPMFWPLHVNWERNWQYLRLDRKMNSSWTNREVNESEKYGWGYDDPLEPMNDVYGTTKGPGEYFTNRDLVELFDPANINLPYMFDDFSWPACD